MIAVIGAIYHFVSRNLYEQRSHERFKAFSIEEAFVELEEEAA
jgi:hypothetical protein